VKEFTFIKWSLAVLLLGAGLLIWAGFSTTPVTPISELSATGAFQHYRVRGRVVRLQVIKTPYPESNIFSYWIADGSGADEDQGTLKIKVEGPVQDDLLEAGKIPEKGQTIDVEGTLYAGDGFRLLSLNSAAMLNVVEEEGK